MPLAPNTVESLLVVDDSTVQRNHAVALCCELGVELIYEAGNGIEALALLSMLVLPPTVIVVDLEMPGMDGVELIQQLHQLGHSMSIIVASSREASLVHAVETMACALGLTVLAALKKPLTAADMQAALLRHGRRADAPAREPETIQVPLEKADLARAIGQGEIIPYYQPKVDIRTGLVRGVEVLARWQHPGHGLVPPDRFIALAEQEDLIHDLTLSIMDRSFRQTAQWNQRGLKLSVAVNLSARLLDAPGLVQEITALAGRHALAAEQIVLEITESSVVTYLGAALGILARLRLKGFRLSIDDYGNSGFSSMQQLARIPFTELKIDRSFVHGAHQRKDLRVILQSALDMSRRLELVTVAEGIETMEDWRLLQEFGCSVGQGYLIARPMPADTLPGWQKKHASCLSGLRIETAAS